MKEQGQKILSAASTVLIAEPALFHFGGPGVIVGLAAGAVAWIVTDEVQKSRQARAGDDVPPAAPVEKKPAPEHPSLGYRLFNGKSVRGEVAAPEPAQPRVSYDFDEEEDLPAPTRKPAGPFLFSQVLKNFKPSLDRLYLGTTTQGEMLFCRAEDLCHVALAGATQGGKSSLQRMLMAQLCAAGASVLLLNPHYSRYLRAKKEDWTPFEGQNAAGRNYLLYPPMECRRYDVIEHYLKQVATEKLPHRLDRFAQGLSTGRPYFLVLDELPDIVKHIPDASGYLDDILRQGAKVGIFVICASQDFLVKTLRLEGGAVRECYRTAYYVGGDATTAKTLLDMPAKDIAEDQMGRGTVMFRSWQASKRAQVMYVPLVDNDALYKLLGPSTYETQDDRDTEDDLSAYDIVTEPLSVDEDEPLSETNPGRTGHFSRALPPSLQTALDVYQSGMSYRDLATVLHVGKDTAGQAVKELKRRGYITMDGVKTV